MSGRQTTAALALGASMLALSAVEAGAGEGSSRPATCGPGVQRACGPLADDSAVEGRRIEPNLEAGGASAADGFRVTVDGSPVALGAAPEPADAQRQADVALAGAQVNVQVTALDARPVLSVVAAKPVVVAGEPAEFHLFSNYAAFVKRAELRIFSVEMRTDGPPLAVLPVALDAPAIWTPPQDQDRTYRYVLRVYDEAGRFDETEPQPLALRAGFARSTTPAHRGPLFDNQRRTANIPVKGAEVTVSGAVAEKGAVVEALGQRAAVAPDGRYLIQQILPAGATAEVKVSIARPDGPPVVIVRKVALPTSDDFLVAIADLTAGHRSFGDAKSLLQGDAADPRRSFVDGRLAFYYRGVFGDYRVTASADTQEQPLDRLFDRFGAKDPRALLRRIDPDRHYPVYGDDSITVEDAPTQGKFYFRLQSDTTEALWGDFKADLGDTRFLQFQRGLYGGRAAYRSPQATGFGERRTEAQVFAADPGTVGSREEFASTGGSVYFLRNPDIAQGSERVFAEVRDRDSGLVIGRTELAAAQDYDFNYVQGRLILRQALPVTADADTFVRQSGLAGNPIWLVVTYEYVPGLARPDALTLGGRAQQWLGDHLRVGVSSYRQGEKGDRQTVQGADVLLRYSSGTFLRSEFAHSRGAAPPVLLSSSGGYDFTSRAGGGGSANAYLLEGALDLSDLHGRLKGHVESYWRSREQGFSAPGELNFGQALDQYGGKAQVLLAPGLTLTAKADIADGQIANRNAAELGLRKETRAGWYGQAGLRYDDLKGAPTPYSPSSDLRDLQGARTDAAVQLGFRHAGGGGRQAALGAASDADWAAFAFGQATLQHDGDRRANNRVGVGGEAKLTDRLTLKGEVSDGDLGWGANVRTDYAISNRGTLYLSYALAAENPDALYSGRFGRIGTGAKYRLSDTVSTFAEGRYDYGAGPTGLSQSYGVDFTPRRDLSFGLRLEAGRLADALGQGVTRRVVGATVDYGDEARRVTSTLEYRHETGASGARETWTTRNTAAWRVDPALRLFAKANVSLSDAHGAPNVLDANFHEFDLAAAYRPVDDDRLNLLTKITYLSDLPSPDQIDRLGLNLNYAQRSWVAAADATYALTTRLDVGAKVAYRVGQLRPSRDASAPWFASHALFLAARADYHVVKAWDVLLEARRLSVSDPSDARTGALVAVYRRLGAHLKLGAGYNFTDYSDDLTDLSYDERGVFLNLIGTW